ncbi:MAG: lamin tail domain-containing protein, partial [Patescibacteria group bacterium]
MDNKIWGEKKLTILIGGLFLVSFLFLPAPRSLAYNDQTTHPDLIRETIVFYELSTGKKLTDEQKQWIAQGSVDEDKAPRWLNHFYDPAFERGLSTTALGFGYAGYSAKNWARFSSYQTLNPANLANLWTGQGPVISGSWWGDFSYEAAIKNYSQSKEKEAYTALGNVLHIIADMTVPEHTRNDAHPGGNLASYYEDWTMNNSAGLTQDLGKRVFNQGRKPVIYGDLGTYFNELASYTNTHFFSPRTINSELYQKPKIVYEDGTFAYGYDENYQLFDLAIVNKKSSYRTTYELKDENNQILQEYWLRLSRQALVNGAGIIHLFVNEAEAAKKVELAKQKVDSGSTGSPQSSFISFISGLFSSSPGDSGPEPAMTIIAGDPQPTAPKINPAAPKITVPAPAVQSPAASPPAPPAVPKANPVVVPKTTPVVQAPAIPPPTPAPTPAPVVVYGGGGGTSSSPAEQTPAQTFAAGDLIINEIMYDLAKANCVTDGTDTNHEWVEIYNNSSRAITLTGGNSGWRFNDGSNHLLNEQGTVGSMTIPVGGFAVLSASTTVFLSDHAGFGGTVIDTAMSLKNTSATIKISAHDSTIIDEVTYDSSWGAKHNCKTLERKSATGGSSDSTNWAESSATGGTPGAANNPIIAGEGGPIEDDTIAGTGTDVSATTTISQNTTWTLANSPYRLFFDLSNHPTVAAGAVLTIEPGVKIIPQSGGATAMEIKGTLQAIAT